MPKYLLEIDGSDFPMGDIFVVFSNGEGIHNSAGIFYPDRVRLTEVDNLTDYKLYIDGQEFDITDDVYIYIGVDNEPEPPPQEPEFNFECIKRVNVRSGPGTTYSDVGDITVGTKVKLSEVKHTGYWVWRQILSGVYAGRYVAERSVDGVTKFFNPIGVVEPEPEPEPKPINGRMEVINSNLVLDGDNSFINGLGFDRLFAHKEQNPHTANLSDIEHFGNPDLPGDKTLGKARDIAKLVRYFAYHKGTNHNTLIANNRRMLDQLHKFGLVSEVCIMDSINYTANMASYEVYHDASHGGHLNSNWYISKAYLEEYKEFLELFLTELGDHPALVILNPLNEPQMWDRSRMATDAFIEFHRWIYETVQRLAPHLLISPGWINRNHISSDWDYLINNIAPYIDICPGHHYQETSDPNALWGQEDHSIGDAQAAIQRGLAYISEEWGQKIDGGYQLESIQKYYERQKRIGASSCMVWAFYFGTQDRNLHSGGFMNPISNPKFYDIVEWMFNNL